MAFLVHQSSTARKKINSLYGKSQVEVKFFALRPRNEKSVGSYGGTRVWKAGWVQIKGFWSILDCQISNAGTELIVYITLLLKKGESLQLQP